jgi:selenocysteine lyase/cysteine desulfurase
VTVLPDDDPGHLDFVALSAHKMYAPFGTGALVGPRDFFAQGDPDMVGGGVVDVVTLESAFWTRPPHKEEAGSPNVIGGVALAAAIDVLDHVGMEVIAEREHHLLDYAFRRLRRIDGLTFYGPTNDLRDKVGTIAFNVYGYHHSLVAAILSAEGAVGVRDGCFCAHPYVKVLLRLTPEEDRELTAEVLSGDRSRLPGMVRASLGCYNTEADIDALADMLEIIARGAYRGKYLLDRRSGAYRAEGFTPDFRKYFAHYHPPREGGIPSEAS